MKIFLQISVFLCFSVLFVQASTPLDTDKDGLTDEDEVKIGTNPNKADTDGDGTNDFKEIWAKTNPLDSGEKVLKDELIGNPLNPESRKLVTVKNGITKEESLSGTFYVSSSAFAVEKQRLISANSSRLQKLEMQEKIEARKAELTKQQKGDEKLNQMDMECKRLYEIMIKNPTQLNRARYNQALSDMFKFQLELYPDSLGGGGNSSLEDLDRKIERLQDSVNQLDR